MASISRSPYRRRRPLHTSDGGWTWKQYNNLLLTGPILPKSMISHPNRDTRSRSNFYLAILSLLSSILLWAVLTDAWGHSARVFPEQLGNAGKYLYGCLSRILWMSPAFILIFRYDKELFWSGKQLFSRPRTERVFLTFLALTTVYALAAMAVTYRSWHIADEDLPLLTVKLLFVAVGEEVVFRGWGYNLLKKSRSDAAALILSAALFAALHCPAYFVKLYLYGRFDWPGVISQGFSAMVCGALFAVMLNRSGTLLDPILAHFYYDWMLEVFG